MPSSPNSRDALIERLEAKNGTKPTAAPPEVVVDSSVRWERSARMQARRADVLQRYKAIHGNATTRTGLYYGTVEAQLVTEGEPTGSYAVARFGAKLNAGSSPVLDSAFSHAIGDTSLGRFGGPRVITEADTNLQNPGQTLFEDEVFYVEAISARLRGVRIQYAPEDIALMKGPAEDERTLTNRIVRGTAFLLDESDGALLFQGDVEHEVNRIGSQIPKIAAAASLHFTWREAGIGGSNTTIDATIAHLADIPGVHEDAGQRTFALPQGYIWCIDGQFSASRDRGGNGLFNVELHAEEDIGLYFKPAAAFGIVPGTLGTKWNGIPTGFAVSWEIRLHGTSFLPAAGADDEAREQYRSITARRMF